MTLEQNAPTPQSLSPAPSGGGGGPARPSGPRGGWRRLWRMVWRSLAGLVLLVALCLAGVLAALRSESVQTLLMEKINAALAPSGPEAVGPDGLRVRLTHLSGPLPLGLSVGLEVFDAQGLWLRAPDNCLAWDWRALPQALRITALNINDLAVLRLPLLPPAPPPPPSEPLTEAALRTALGDLARSLNTLPGWLPEVRLETLRVDKARVPQSLLGAPESAASPAPQPSAESGSAPALADSGAPAPDAASARAPSAPPPGAEALARLELHLAAGKGGAALRAQAGLAGAEHSLLLPGGTPCAGLELTFETALTPASEGGTVGVEAWATLEAELRLPDGTATPAPKPLLQALLGSKARLNLRLEGGVSAPAASGPASGAHAALSALDVTMAGLKSGGHAAWRSADKEDPWLAGALDVDMAVDMPALAGTDGTDAGPSAAFGPLDMLHAPLAVKLSAQGPLDKPDLRLAVDCADLRANGHSLADAAVRLEALPLNWRAALAAQQAQPLNPAAPALAPAAAISPEAAPHAALPQSGAPTADAGPAAHELLLGLDVRAKLDRQPVSLSTEIFAGFENSLGLQALNVGLRRLTCSALGVESSGQLGARLPQSAGAASMPQCNGKLDVRVADWKALSSLLGGARLDGEAGFSLELRAGAPDKAQAEQPQEATLRWRVPRLDYSAKGAAAASLRGLEGEARLTDVFGKAQLAARLELANARQGDLHLGARLRAQGAVTGPLDASLETTGSLLARLEARWQPGLVELRRLELNLPRQQVGLKTASGASLRYGEAGLGISGLDVALTPSGRLRAQGALGKDKLDLRLDLERLALTPWKKILAALPEGTVEARVRLTGSPAQPGGDLRVDVRQLHLPGSPLKPMDLTLNGRLEREGSARNGALAVRLDVDPASVKALGGTECRVEARVPLLFGADGLPQPAMSGPLRGKVRWNGAVAPLWTLVPLADQRLTGQVALAVDLGGTLEAPGAKGFVQVDKARYENLALGVLLTDTNLRLDLEEGQGGKPGLARVRLAIADGLGGKALIAGHSALDGKSLNFKADVDHLRPLRRRDARIDLSGQVTVAGSAAAPEVRGQITVNQGTVLLNNLDVGVSVTTLPITEAGPEAARAQVRAGKAASAPPPPPAPKKAATAGQGLLDLRLVVPRRFLVEGYGLKSEWQADMRVEGTPAEPLISGQLNAVKGSLDFLGKTFKLSRGSIAFGGGAVSNPLLDIMLTEQTPELVAHISVTGTARKMKLTLSSEPELPRDEILAQILFGKNTSELGRLENLRLAAAVASLAGFGSGGGGGGMFDSTRQALGMDVLRFNSSKSGSGQDSGDMTAGTSVEMGKYLTEDIYVGVEQGMKQGSTAFVLQWELTPRTNVELRTEEGSTKAGLSWKYNY